jgi:hypothetical protein
VKFRKRPVVIEAVQWSGDNADDVRVLTGPDHFAPIEDGFTHESGDVDVTATVFDVLHSTWVGVKTGQWVIRGVQGETYPCAADVFAATYEPAEV